MRRHDAIVAYLSRNLSRAGFTVNIEPRYVTREGVRKPDIVASMGSTTLVLDAQVSSDIVSLSTPHRNKVNYYAQNDDLISQIKANTRSSLIQVVAATLPWRGVWGPESASKLLQLGVLRKRDLPIISTRVIIGGLGAFRKINRSTAAMNFSHTHRRGIG